MNEYRIQMKNYKHLVIRKVDGQEVYNDIKGHINNGENVVVDFDEIDTMTTFFAKQVFGRLYVEMGPEDFSKRIKFDKKHMSEDVDLVLSIGIDGALSDMI